MTFRVHCKDVSRQLAAQMAENECTVSRILSNIRDLRSGREMFLDDAKAKMSVCRELDRETHHVMATIKSLWGKMSQRSEDDSFCSALDELESREETCKSVLVTDKASLTEYLNAKCDKDTLSDTVCSECDPFTRLLQENETLAADLKAKKRTISDLKRMLNHQEVASLPLSTCASPEASTVNAAKIRKKLRFLLACLDAKVKENRALLDKIEASKARNRQEEAKLREENKLLRSRLASSIKHKRSLEQEIHRSYQVIKQCEQEKLKLLEKLHCLEITTNNNNSSRNGNNTFSPE